MALLASPPALVPLNPFHGPLAQPSPCPARLLPCPLSLAARRRGGVHRRGPLQRVLPLHPLHHLCRHLPGRRRHPPGALAVLVLCFLVLHKGRGSGGFGGWRLAPKRTGFNSPAAPTTFAQRMHWEGTAICCMKRRVHAAAAWLQQRSVAARPQSAASCACSPLPSPAVPRPGHPLQGYGFLSENATFVDICADHNLVRGGAAVGLMCSHAAGAGAVAWPRTRR